MALSNNINSFTVIILAAGASTRLGSPKQLLVYNQSNLIGHSISEAVNSGANAVIVVLGSDAGIIENELRKFDVKIITNAEWQQGMSTSIRTGIEYLEEHYRDIETVILTVCDQPHVTSSLLQALADAHAQSGKGIVASEYDGTVGTPALFNKKYFSELKQLQGDTGAKKIILGNEGDVELFPFPLGTIDIDTKADYEQLKKQSEA